MPGRAVGKWLECIGTYAMEVPRDNVIDTILSASERGWEEGRYDRKMLRDGLGRVIDVLAERGFTSEELAPLQTYMRRLLAH